MKNEPWLSSAIELVNKSVDVSTTDYKLLIYIFYEFMSNRSLAKFISILYNLNKIDVYFQIDNIIARENENTSEIQYIMEKLKANGLLDWLEETAD